ncbi:hypothetical protein APUTEX25_000860, partial [Auxenochlorella protothecoides]
FASWSEAWIAESLDVEESTLSQLARAVRYGVRVSFRVPEEQLDPNASESAVWNSSPPKAGVQPSVAHSQEALPGSRGPSPPCPDVSSWGAESVQVLLQERTIELELERARRQALQQALLEAEERARLLAQDREQLADRHRAELEDLAAACDAELAEARGLHCREVAELAAAYEAQLEGTQDQVAMLEDRLNVTQYGGTPMGHPNIQTRSDRGSPTNAMEAPVRDLFDSPMKGVCGTAQAGDAFCGMPPPLAAQPSLVSAASQQAVTADSCPWDSSSSDEDGAPAPHRSSPEIEVGAPRHVHGAPTGGVEGSTSLHQAQQGTLAARPAPVPGTAAVEERHLRSEIAALNRKLERGGESLCKATHAIRVLHFKLQRERQSVARLQADKCMLQSRLLAALGEAVEAEGGLAGHGPPTSKQLQDSDTLPPEIDDQEADAVRGLEAGLAEMARRLAAAEGAARGELAGVQARTSELQAALEAARADVALAADLQGGLRGGDRGADVAILKRTVAALTSLRKRAGDDAARLATLKGAAGEAEALRKASGARERELGDCREARRVAEAACAAAEARALRLEGAAAALRLLAQAHGYVFEEAVDAGAATCAEGPGRYASSEDAELCPLKSAVRHLDRALAAALAGRCEAETEREASRRALAAAERKLAEARAEAEGLRGRAAESSAAAAAAGADMALLEAQAGTLRRELEFLGLQLADAREEGEAGASRAAAEALERAAHQQVVVGLDRCVCLAGALAAAAGDEPRARDAAPEPTTLGPAPAAAAEAALLRAVCRLALAVTMDQVGGSRDAAQVVAELQPGIRAQEELLAAMGLDRVWQALVGLAGRKTPARSGCRSGTPPATPCSAPSASGWRALSQPPLESLALLAADVAWVLGEHPASLAAAGREGAPDPETTVAVLIEAVRSLMQRHRGVLRLLRGQGRVNDRNLADSASQAVSIGRHACTAGADQCRSPPARPSSHRGLVRERRGRRERERPAGLDAHSHVKQGLDRLIRAAGGPAWDDAALGSGIESEEEECIPLRTRFATPPAQALT